jgi:two-component system NarL family sensor kinase
MAIIRTTEASKSAAPETILLEALEKQRTEIAAALRSETTQVLATVLVGLAAAAESDDLQQTRALLGELRDGVRADLDRLRALASRIRPSVLDDFGLAAAVEGLARSLVTDDGPTIDVSLSEVDSALPSAQSTMAFRAIEEAIRNAVQHGAAKHIKVSLISMPVGLQFEVRDDGRGFDVAARKQKFIEGSGLLLMQAYARALGGSLELASREGAGTRVVLRIPRGKIKWAIKSV